MLIYKSKSMMPRSLIALQIHLLILAYATVEISCKSGKTEVIMFNDIKNSSMNRGDSKMKFVKDVEDDEDVKWNCDDTNNCNLKMDAKIDVWMKENFETTICINDTNKGIYGEIKFRVKSMNWYVDGDFIYNHVRGVQYGRYGSNYYSCDGEVYKTCGSDSTLYYVNGKGEEFVDDKLTLIVGSDSNTFRTYNAKWYDPAQTGTCACTGGYDDVWFCIQRIMTYNIEDYFISVFRMKNINRYRMTMTITAFGTDYDVNLDQSTTDDVSIDVSGFGQIAFSGLSSIDGPLYNQYMLMKSKAKYVNGTNNVEVLETRMATSVPDLGSIPSEGLGKFQIVRLGNEELLYDKSITKDFNFHGCDLSSSRTVNTVKEYVLNTYSKNIFTQSELGVSTGDNRLGAKCCISIISASADEVNTILSNYPLFDEKNKEYGLVDKIEDYKMLPDNTTSGITLTFKNLVKQKVTISVLSNDLSYKIINKYGNVEDFIIENITMYTASSGSFATIKAKRVEDSTNSRIRIKSSDCILGVNYVNLDMESESTYFDIAILKGDKKDEYEICMGEDVKCRTHIVDYLAPEDGGTDNPDDNENAHSRDKTTFTHFIEYMYTGIITSIVCTLVFVLDALLGVIVIFASWKTLKRTMLLLIFMFSCGKYDIKMVDAIEYNYLNSNQTLVITKQYESSRLCTGLSETETNNILNTVAMGFRPYAVIKLESFMKSNNYGTYFNNYGILQNVASTTQGENLLCEAPNCYGGGQTAIEVSRTLNGNTTVYKNILINMGFYGVKTNKYYCNQYFMKHEYINTSMTLIDEIINDRMYVVLYDYSSILFKTQQLMRDAGATCDLSIEKPLYYANIQDEESTLTEFESSTFSRERWGRSSIMSIPMKRPIGTGVSIISIMKKKYGKTELGVIFLSVELGYTDDSINDLVEKSAIITGTATLICSSSVKQPYVGYTKYGFYMRCIIICEGKCSITVNSENVLVEGKKLNNGFKNGMYYKTPMINTDIIYNSFDYDKGKTTIDLNGKVRHRDLTELNVVLNDNKNNRNYIGNSVRTLMNIEKMFNSQQYKSVKNKMDFHKMLEKSKYTDKTKIIDKYMNGGFKMTDTARDLGSAFLDGIGLTLSQGFALIDGTVFELNNDNDIVVQCDPTNGTVVICDNDMGIFVINNTELGRNYEVEFNKSLNLDINVVIPSGLIYKRIGLKKNRIGKLYYNRDGNLVCDEGKCLLKESTSSEWAVLKKNGTKIKDWLGKGKYENFRTTLNMYGEHGMFSHEVLASTGCSRCKFTCMMSCTKDKMTSSYWWFFLSPLYVLGFLMLWILLVNLFYLIVVSGFKKGSSAYIRGGYKKLKNVGYNIADGKLWNKEGKNKNRYYDPENAKAMSTSRRQVRKMLDGASSKFTD